MPRFIHKLGLIALAATPLHVLAAEQAAAPVKALEPMSAAYLVQVIIGLLVVVAGIIALMWLMRRLGRFQTGAGGALQVIGGLSMGARERIVLLQVGETQVLVGVAPGRVQTLHVLDKPVSVPQRDVAAGESFAARLHSAMRRGGAQ